MGETTMHTHSYGQFRISKQPNMHVFGWWRQARVPGENPHMQYEEHTSKLVGGKSF